jgi:D-alanyl-D-alanine-carboxypeptidase/D-alanyl-D-alanine-endopeptidase
VTPGRQPPGSHAPGSHAPGSQRPGSQAPGGQAPTDGIPAAGEPIDPIDRTRRAVEEHLRPLITGRVVAGLVYAAVTPDGPVTGELAGAGGGPLGPQVSVEIGSVTKVFTALLLAEAASRAEVSLDDPVGRHLPPGLAAGCQAAGQITLRQLATHTSGLPRLPANLLPAALLHPSDPYARYTAEQLSQALRRVRGRAGQPAAAGYRYSNFGYGLLGFLLSRAAGRCYPDLLADRITGPLGLAGTGIGVPAGQAAAIGHRGRRPVPPWHLGVLAGAGALRSTAADLARFLAAQLDPAATPLGPAIEATQRPQPAAPGGPVTGLGWHITSQDGHPVRWHNGGTAGFSAIVAVDRPAGCALAAVATSAPRRGLPLDRATMAGLAALRRGRR